MLFIGEKVQVLSMESTDRYDGYDGLLGSMVLATVKSDNHHRPFLPSLNKIGWCIHHCTAHAHTSGQVDILGQAQRIPVDSLLLLWLSLPPKAP